MGDHLIDSLLGRWVFPMVKVGPKFILPYGARTRSSLVEGGDYDSPFLPFLERVLSELGDPKFAPGSYFPGGWYKALTARGQDPAHIQVTAEGLAPFYRPELRVDPHGRWWSGEKRIKGRVLQFFLGHLKYEPELGLYCVRYPLERIEEAQYIHTESPPFRVQRVDLKSLPPRLVLNDGTIEVLRPESLWLDRQDQLYCLVKFDRTPTGVIAAVDDPARWEMLSTLEEDAGSWSVRIGGARQAIPVRG